MEEDEFKYKFVADDSSLVKVINKVKDKASEIKRKFAFEIENVKMMFKEKFGFIDNGISEFLNKAVTKTRNAFKKIEYFVLGTGLK